MSIDDNTNNQDSFFEKKEKASPYFLPLMIFLAVFAAVIVAMLLKDAYDEYRLRKSVSEFVQEVKIISDEIDKEVKKIEVENAKLINRSLQDTQRSFNSVIPPPIDTDMMHEENLEHLESDYYDEDNLYSE